MFRRDRQFYKFSFYGFLKNLQFFSPFLILFFLRKNLSYAEIGVLYAVREITVNLLEIPSGLAADLLGRKKIMLCAFSAYILSFIIYYFLQGFYPFLIAGIFFAAGDAFRTGTHKAMIMHYLRLNHWDQYKTAYYGATRSFSQIGSAASALIAALIVFLSGNLNTVFLWSIIPYLAGLILISTYPASLDISGAENTPLSFKKKGKAILQGLRIFFREPDVRRIYSGAALFSGLFKAVKDYIQPVIKSAALAIPLGATLTGDKRIALLSGAVYFTLHLGGAWGSASAWKLENIFKKQSKLLNLILLSGFSLVIITGLLYTNILLYSALALFAVIYILENIRRPVAVSLISSRAVDSIRGTALSVESQLKSLSAALFALAMGFLSEYLGVGKALMLCGGTALLLFPLYVLGRGDLSSVPDQ